MLRITCGLSIGADYLWVSTGVYTWYIRSVLPEDGIGIQAGRDSAAVKDFNTALQAGLDSLIIISREKHRLRIVWPPALDGLGIVI